ncbi:hypothetical protein [Fructobacillus papyrifericola]|uniref:Uncharacterized protein n=1 Tax=Fructobacillus papyrifericola TaxID=2713172 RepID=A0ABS5QV35_9LACO|nr:hypothetical protein [Fructobacillus papyrifericola]MBS9336677.1 hypothetical protein [Fructobacillus papyrifericola]
MLTQLVTGSVSGQRFDKKLNEALKELQNHDHEIVDVKYAQSLARVSALILYK